MLEMQHRDITSEVMWVSLGGLVGALPSAADAIMRYMKEPYIFSVPDLFQIVIFVGSGAVFGVTTWLNRRHARDREDIFTKIRSQKRD